MIKNRIFALIIALLMIVFSAFALISCNNSPSGEQGGIHTPVDPDDGDGQQGQMGNLPSNPNREDSYQAK